MSKQHDAHGLRLWLFAGAALISGLVCDVEHGWAKHHNTKKQSTGSADPCAEPTAFIMDNIAKMRALQASMNAAAPNSVTSWLSELEGGKKSFDSDDAAKISELRHDADGVNELLRAGGCKTVDIDRELAKPSTTTGSISPKK